MTAHRVLPVSQAWDYEGPTEHRCLHCHAVKRYPDEFDEFPCHDPLPGFET